MAGLSESYPQYAPAADLTAYLGESLPDADARLQEASGDLGLWTKSAIYATDPADGWTPTNTKIKNAFHDAAILQAAAKYRAGLKPGDNGGTVAGTIQSKSLGSRSVTYAANASADAAKVELANGALAPGAAQVLGAAGLLGGGFISVGGEWDRDILARQWVSS